LVVALLLVGTVFSVNAQSDDGEFFPATRHYVRGPILAFYRANGGEAAFGQPITIQFLDPHSGRQVQYFEYARLESWPEYPASYNVQLGLLAAELNLGQPAAPAASDPACHYFVQTGHSVCFAFLDYYRLNNGLLRLGYPIGEFQIENGRIVQVFQRGMLEWRRELPAGLRVQAVPLGKRNFMALGYDLAWTNPLPNTATPVIVTQLAVEVTLGLPVVRQAEEEQIRLVVRDQVGSPVEGAGVTVTVNFPTGELVYILPATDAQGRTSIGFPVSQAPPGRIVSVDIEVEYSGVDAETRTSFISWW